MDLHLQQQLQKAFKMTKTLDADGSTLTTAIANAHIKNHESSSIFKTLFGMTIFSIDEYTKAN